MAGRSPALIVKPVKQHTATLIFVHGLGDSGAGWTSLASNWRQRGKFEHVKFLFPNAPNIPISANFGMQMPGWYDIHGFDSAAEAGQDEVGILRSKEYFDTIIANEVITHKIPSERIVLGGFSQGGAISLITGLTSSRPLAGIVGLSSYLPIGEKIPDLIKAASPAPSKDVPIFVGHGEADPLVKFDWARRSRQAIEGWGWKVEFHSYPRLEHSVDPQEIDDLEKWLEQRLPDEPLTTT